MRTGRRLVLDPGLLRTQAVLEKPVETSDGAGGVSTVWAPANPLSVRIEPRAPERRERFDRVEAVQRHRVLCRAGSGAARGGRFRIGERLLAIETVHDPDETGRFLLCLCVEEI
ncbi:head-tail adaptor protein [Fulvimarina endophytica]|uniref:Head-tail adaptor protein n=1 Tax=Fulvimarina endophytica TaxID=2293836 RepID=A0A371X4R1_9HYPH|nr:head-tail adaptor protein [Fulvimarina endophytica]RFC64221.1 head-tail adaptor protein [Fulvimarina endophytica]